MIHIRKPKTKRTFCDYLLVDSSADKMLLVSVADFAWSDCERCTVRACIAILDAAAVGQALEA